MQVLVRLGRHVIVNDDVDLLDINTATQQVCANHDTVLTLLELVVNLKSIRHRHATVTSTTRETLLRYDVV